MYEALKQAKATFFFHTHINLVHVLDFKMSVHGQDMF